MVNLENLKKTAIRLTEKFANVNSNYSVVGMPKLVGAYANYFEVVYGDDGFKYIRVKNGFEGRLKKGFTYKLKVKYTLKMASSYSNDNLGKEDIYRAGRVGTSWGNAELVKGLNTKDGNEAVQAVTMDGEKMVLQELKIQETS